MKSPSLGLFATVNGARYALSLLLALCLASEASACKAQLVNSSWFETINPNSEAWRRISVRNPSAPLMDPNYPAELYEAISSVFKPAYEAAGNTLNLVAVLAKQNQLYINGKDGKKLHFAASRREFTGRRDSAGPGGVYLHDQNSFMRVSYTIRPEAVIGALDRHFLSLFQLARASGFLLRGFKEPHEAFPEQRLEHATPVIEVIEIPRSGARVWNEYFHNYISHFYTSAHENHRLLKALNEVLLEIRSINPQRSSDQLRAMKLIAEYLYISCSAHFFSSANFSLAMGNVNYLLSTFGLFGMPHGRYDYLAHTKAYPMFEAIFLRDLLTHNHENPNLGLELSSYSRHSNPNDTYQINARIPLEIRAHLAQVGDRLFRDGELTRHAPGVNSLNLEGFSIETSDLPYGLKLEYQSRAANGEESGWNSGGVLVGSRGRSLPLTGIAIRLGGVSADSYNIWYQLYVEQEGFTHFAKNGEFLTGKDARNIKFFRVYLERIGS